MIKKRIQIEERHLPALLLILSGLLVFSLAFLSSVSPVNTAPTDFNARSQDDMILLTWTNPKAQKDALILTISSDNTVQSVQLPYDATSYTFSDGEHGQLYTFSLAPNADRTTQAQSDCALFLDWQQLPALPLVSIETVNGQPLSYSTVAAPEGL